MALAIEDEPTIALARALADRNGKPLTEAIQEAPEFEIRRIDAGRFAKTVDDLVTCVRTFPPTGLKADKAFFDDLYDE